MKKIPQPERPISWVVEQRSTMVEWKGLPEEFGRDVALAQRLGFTVEVRAADGKLVLDAVKWRRA